MAVRFVVEEMIATGVIVKIYIEIIIEITILMTMPMRAIAMGARVVVDDNNNGKQ